jgi:hypothetical protein
MHFILKHVCEHTQTAYEYTHTLSIICDILRLKSCKHTLRASRLVERLSFLEREREQYAENMSEKNEQIMFVIIAFHACLSILIPSPLFARAFHASGVLLIMKTFCHAQQWQRLNVFPFCQRGVKGVV